MADEPGKTAALHTPGGEFETTIRPATEGASAFEIDKLLSSTGLTTYDPGYGNTAPVSSAITYIDGDGDPAVPRLPDRPARGEVDLPGDELPAHLRRAAQPGAARRVHQEDQPAHAAARRSQGVLQRLPARRASDARAVQRGVGAVDVLPGRARPVRRERGRARPCGCWQSCPPSRRTRTKKSMGRSSTRTTRWTWWRTSCG